jgi:hypothetical protein
MPIDDRGSSRRDLVLWLLVLLPYVGGILLYLHYRRELDQIRNSNFILIDKSDYTLRVYDYEGRMLARYGIALGSSVGNKRSIGDMRTPEGVFKIESVENAGSWSHDFKNDTLGEIKGAYGPYFIRLKVPGQRGIGIHGTHEPNSIGKRVSEGCIRMRNEDIEKLVKRINRSSVVAILPGRMDVRQNEMDEEMTMSNVGRNDTIAVTRKPVIVKSDGDKKAESRVNGKVTR